MSWIREVLERDAEAAPERKRYTELRDLVISEISGVDDAASSFNGWLVMKQADTEQARFEARVQELLEPVAKAHGSGLIQRVIAEGSVRLGG